MCGKSPAKAELPELSNPAKFLTLYSLRRKIVYRCDHPLKSYIVHASGAAQILRLGNGWHQVGCFSPPSRVTRPKRTIGVLNGKLYLDDFAHALNHNCGNPLCDGLMLTPTEINLCMGITPAERQPIDSQTRQLVLERYDHKCARCHKPRTLDLHHRLPVIHGGTNAPNNLIPLCHPCHVRHSEEFTEHIWPDLQSIFLNSEKNPN